MAQFKEFIRGDAFNGTVYYTPPKGGLPNLIGYTPSSKIIDAAGNRFEAETCTISEDGLSVNVIVSASKTKSFAVGLAKWNVRFIFGNDPNSVFSTAIGEFEVIDPPTNTTVS